MDVLLIWMFVYVGFCGCFVNIYVLSILMFRFHRKMVPPQRKYLILLQDQREGLDTKYSLVVS